MWRERRVRAWKWITKLRRSPFKIWGQEIRQGRGDKCRSPTGFWEKSRGQERLSPSTGPAEIGRRACWARGEPSHRPASERGSPGLQQQPESVQLPGLSFFPHTSQIHNLGLIFAFTISQPTTSSSYWLFLQNYPESVHFSPFLLTDWPTPPSALT